MDRSRSPTDTAVNINVTQDAAVAGTNYLFASGPGGPLSTLTAGVSSSATVFPLASTTGIAVGNGICISPSPLNCAITMGTNMALSTGEVALVTAISGLNVTVKRGSIGTAAAYSSGQAVTLVRSGSYSIMAANVIRDFYAGVISNPFFGSQSSAIAVAAQTALAANAQLPH